MIDMDEYRKVCLALGYQEPISIESDGECWTGTFENKQVIPAADVEKQLAKMQTQFANDAVSAARVAAYAAPGGSDGVFFKWQRGEATEQEWLDAVEAINTANPYPVK